MNKFIVPVIVILFLLVTNKVGATIQGYTVIAKSDKDNIAIYAKELDGLYYDFKIYFKGTVYSRPFWMNVTNPTYAPDIYYEDINNDEKKELIIILTKGYGTGLLDQEIDVFHTDYNRFVEVLVDNPLAIVNKKVKTSLTPDIAEIIIGNIYNVINVKELKPLPETLFQDINFGSITKYEVKNKKLIATLHPQFSPGAFFGSLIITYEYRDKMYQAKSIVFEFAN